MLDTTKTYTSEEVAKLLACYAQSDSGTYSAEEAATKTNWMPELIAKAERWLAFEQAPVYFLRNIREQKYLALTEMGPKWTNDRSEALEFKTFAEITKSIESFQDNKLLRGMLVVDKTFFQFN